MSGFLAIGLFVCGLVLVALVMLVIDVARGDVGGHHTLERARRLLVVSTSEATLAGANDWIERNRAEHPRIQCFVLAGAEDQESFMAVQDAVERDRPDAVVVARLVGARHASLEGLYGRLKEDLDIPVDAIYVEGGAAS